MPVSTFIGRKEELARIEELYKKAYPSLMVVKGRRRVGKSRLIGEFASRHPQYRLWDVAGLAPTHGMTDQSQRDHFARQLALFLKIPPLTFQDWSDAFAHLSTYLQAGDIVLLDEISWMGDKDPTFIPKLKAWWDKQTIPILLVFCSSISTWIEENILKSTAFFGRVNLTLTLEPLTIPESAELLRQIGFKTSAYEIYELLSILGGIPWYLEQLSPDMTADENIRQLCFKKDGLLVLEFERIFHDLFNGRGSTYKKILEVLKETLGILDNISKNIQETSKSFENEFLPEPTFLYPTYNEAFCEQSFYAQPINNQPQLPILQTQYQESFKNFEPASENELYVMTEASSFPIQQNAEEFLQTTTRIASEAVENTLPIIIQDPSFSNAQIPFSPTTLPSFHNQVYQQPEKNEPNEARKKRRDTEINQSPSQKIKRTKETFEDTIEINTETIKKSSPEKNNNASNSPQNTPDSDTLVIGAPFIKNRQNPKGRPPKNLNYNFLSDESTQNPKGRVLQKK